MRDSNRTTRPVRSRRIASWMVRKSLSQRLFWNTESRTSFSRATAARCLASSTVMVNGLSTTTLWPARIASSASGARTDDFFQLVLRYGELVATLGAGSLVSGGSARFSVHGDRASVVKQKPDVQEDQLRAGVLPGSRDWGLDPDDGVLYEGASGDTRVLKAARGDQRGYYVALHPALHPALHGRA